MNILERGTQVTVNGNSEAIVLGYDKELDMYDVRLWDGTRLVGDVVKPREEIEWGNA
jgi:hypothetical protein